MKKKASKIALVLYKFFETQWILCGPPNMRPHPNQGITYVLLPPFEIIRHFSLCRYIDLTMYAIAKSMYLEKSHLII